MNQQIKLINVLGESNAKNASPICNRCLPCLECELGIANDYCSLCFFSKTLCVF